MSRDALPLRVATLGAAALVFLATIPAAEAQVGAGNSGRHRQHANGPKPKFVPIHELVRVAGFKVYTLSPAEYNLMASEMVTLPTGFGGVVKKPQSAVLLTYGWKRGGLARVYESPTIPGVPPAVLVAKIADAGLFHDVDRRKGWYQSVYSARGVSVVATSASPKVSEAAAKSVVP